MYIKTETWRMFLLIAYDRSWLWGRSGLRWCAFYLVVYILSTLFFPLAFASSPTTTAVSEISRLVDTWYRATIGFSAPRGRRRSCYLRAYTGHLSAVLKAEDNKSAPQRSRSRCGRKRGATGFSSGGFGKRARSQWLGFRVPRGRVSNEREKKNKKKRSERRRSVRVDAGCSARPIFGLDAGGRPQRITYPRSRRHRIECGARIRSIIVVVVACKRRLQSTTTGKSNSLFIICPKKFRLRYDTDFFVPSTK